MGVEVIPFALFAAAMVGTPGPANMVLMTAGARYGLRPALPFVAGVALGKQLIIWPIGFGLIGVLSAWPLAFATLKFASAAYIVWLAWRIAGSRIVPGQAAGAPSFASGLIVHPLNPKAWAMITTGFTGFVAEGTSALTATMTIALTLICLQAVLHPLWCAAGSWIAARIAGTGAERALMVGLAVLTVASVALVLVKGDDAMRLWAFVLSATPCADGGAR